MRVTASESLTSAMACGRLVMPAYLSCGAEECIAFCLAWPPRDSPTTRRMGTAYEMDASLLLLLHQRMYGGGSSGLPPPAVKPRDSQLALKCQDQPYLVRYGKAGIFIGFYGSLSPLEMYDVTLRSTP